MKFPKIGETVFGFQHIEDRAGETMFLTTTQCNCNPNLQSGIKESLEEIATTHEEINEDGDVINVIDNPNSDKLVVWQMMRIR